MVCRFKKKVVFLPSSYQMANVCLGKALEKAKAFSGNSLSVCIQSCVYPFICLFHIKCKKNPNQTSTLLKVPLINDFIT